MKEICHLPSPVLAKKLRKQLEKSGINTTIIWDNQDRYFYLFTCPEHYLRAYRIIWRGDR